LARTFDRPVGGRCELRGGQCRRIGDLCVLDLFYHRRLDNGDRLWDEPINGHRTDCQHQQDDDQDVDLASGLTGDGLAAIDVLLALQPLRSHLVDPGEDQHRDEAQDQQHDDERSGPFRHGQQ
jgi:hypothetical protein